MRKIINLITVSIITFFLLLSCSNDNNSNSINESLIIGTWNGESSTFNGQNSGIPDNNVIIFSSNGRVKFIYEDFGNNGEDIIDEGDWTLSETNLIIIWDEADPMLEIVNYEILELTNTKLKWSSEVDGNNILIETFTK